ncbi:MAG: hypothetical protein LBP89_01160 [Helicobacteraceae bacterium]|jgi:hypothetical protein|nr:hypothetical protein [Helicobacteraceae bacterium]
MKKIMLALALSASAFACSINYTVSLLAFKDDEIVELRSGLPGSSSIVSRKRAINGNVGFIICAWVITFWRLAKGKASA